MRDGAPGGADDALSGVPREKLEAAARVCACPRTTFPPPDPAPRRAPRLSRSITRRAWWFDRQRERARSAPLTRPLRAQVPRMRTARRGCGATGARWRLSFRRPEAAWPAVRARRQRTVDFERNVTCALPRAAKYTAASRSRSSRPNANRAAVGPRRRRGRAGAPNSAPGPSARSQRGLC